MIVLIVISIYFIKLDVLINLLKKIFREIVGFIDEIEGPKIVGKTQQYRLLKFILNNNSRHRIQVVAWNAEIDRIKHHIQPNRVSCIHLSFFIRIISLLWFNIILLLKCRLFILMEQKQRNQKYQSSIKARFHMS